MRTPSWALSVTEPTFARGCRWLGWAGYASLATGRSIDGLLCDVRTVVTAALLFACSASLLYVSPHIAFAARFAACFLFTVMADIFGTSAFAATVLRP